MKIYIDSAQVSTWSLPVGCPAVSGVTTNPTLVYQAGLPVTLASYERLLQSARDHGFSELMLQLPYSDSALALQWVERLRSVAYPLQVQLTIKLPCHVAWLPCKRPGRRCCSPDFPTASSLLLPG
jgi:hypothetical protein